MDKHEKFLARYGIGRKFDRPNYFPERYVDTNPIPLSNTIPGNGFKHSVDDYKWKRERMESTSTIMEIERKKTQIAPLFNKGGVQFITPETDLKTMGRKL